MMGMAEKNQAAALEWAQQRRQKLERARHMRAERSRGVLETEHTFEPTASSSAPSSKRSSRNSSRVGRENNNDKSARFFDDSLEEQQNQYQQDPANTDWMDERATYGNTNMPVGGAGHGFGPSIVAGMHGDSNLPNHPIGSNNNYGNDSRPHSPSVDSLTNEIQRYTKSTSRQNVMQTHQQQYQQVHQHEVPSQQPHVYVGGEYTHTNNNHDNRRVSTAGYGATFAAEDNRDMNMSLRSHAGIMNSSSSSHQIHEHHVGAGEGGGMSGYTTHHQHGVRRHEDNSNHMGPARTSKRNIHPQTRNHDNRRSGRWPDHDQHQTREGSGGFGFGEARPEYSPVSAHGEEEQHENTFEFAASSQFLNPAEIQQYFVSEPDSLWRNQQQQLSNQDGGHEVSRRGGGGGGGAIDRVEIDAVHRSSRQNGQAQRVHRNEQHSMQQQQQQHHQDQDVLRPATRLSLLKGRIGTAVANKRRTRTASDKRPSKPLSSRTNTTTDFQPATKLERSQSAIDNVKRIISSEDSDSPKNYRTNSAHHPTKVVPVAPRHVPCTRQQGCECSQCQNDISFQSMLRSDSPAPRRRGNGSSARNGNKSKSRARRPEWNSDNVVEVVPPTDTLNDMVLLDTSTVDTMSETKTSGRKKDGGRGTVPEYPPHRLDFNDLHGQNTNEQRDRSYAATTELDMRASMGGKQDFIEMQEDRLQSQKKSQYRTTPRKASTTNPGRYHSESSGHSQRELERDARHAPQDRETFQNGFEPPPHLFQNEASISGPPKLKYREVFRPGPLTNNIPAYTNQTTKGGDRREGGGGECERPYVPTTQRNDIADVIPTRQQECTRQQGCGCAQYQNAGVGVGSGFEGSSSEFSNGYNGKNESSSRDGFGRGPRSGSGSGFGSGGMVNPESGETVSEFANEQVELKQCPDCSRKFNPTSFVKHTKVCNKVQAKRKVFNMAEARLNGVAQTEEDKAKLKQVILNDRKAQQNKSKRNGNKATSNINIIGLGGKQNGSAPKWKKQSGNLREMMQYNRKLAKAEARAKSTGKTLNIADLPPAPVQETEDMVPCPHCNRTYNEKAAERHIPRCKDMRAKPNRLVRGGGRTAGKGKAK